MADTNQIIIIKRIEEDEHDAHHGGGWKVAYADFMTAMMAFFLLLWILAASDEVKLRGLADYFTPSLSDAGGGGMGLLEGSVLGPEGVKSGSEGEMSEVQLPSFGQENPLAVFDSRLRDDEPTVVVEYEVGPPPAAEQAAPSQTTPEQEAQALVEAAELEQKEDDRQAAMDALENGIREKIIERVDLKDLAENIRFEQTAEGLMVEIVDKDGLSMFDSGSALIGTRTRDLIRIIADAIVDLPNTISISGHTDSVPYTMQASYTNWELSADRANATRRVLVDTGVNPLRITSISGLADTAPLDPELPTAAENRRISILVSYPEF